MNFKPAHILILALLLVGTALFGQNNNLLPDTIRYCQGDTTGSIAIVSPFGNKTTVSWETPMGKFANTRKVLPYKQGKYFVKVSSPQFVRSLSDSTYVRVYKKPYLHLKDTAVCKGQSILLDAKNPGATYLWSNGETGQRAKISNPGKIWVKIMSGSCTFYDTVVVNSPEGSGVNINPESVFCLNDQLKILTVKAGTGTKILWNTGAVTPTINVTREGKYWVKTESPLCGVRVDSVKVKLKACECEMFIPNSFTPNEDNRNDYFFPTTQCEYSYYSIVINDRWGSTVFSGTSVNARWDGRFKGNLCPEDIYYYRIETTEKHSEKKQVREGHLSLIR